MDASRWQRIQAIFHALLDKPPGPERDASLEELTGGDAALAAEVRDLLAADDRLEAPAHAGDHHLGLRLGNYEVGPLIARGGMASVYQAHRADEQFRQRVAVKIMDVRLSDPGLVARFGLERQILAGLEHPAITRLMDGGVTPLGEPYLVMEYVDGFPIDEYCDERRLGILDRVRLFIEACGGVAFAHRNLILHRDLKPSNILVTADGHPKVLDFGTATPLQPERSTTVSGAPLTPAYASPEQLKGQPVGTATDQYSLGLVLYEMLTGTPAFPQRASLIAAVERAVTGTEPQPAAAAVTEEAAAARRTTLKKLRSRLTGDLGRIVAKAIATDPGARYSSVQHMVEDLDRWLRGEAILGRPPSVPYRVARFVARHSRAVAVAAVLLVSLVAATIVSVQQAVRARNESARARELNRFLTQMLSSANPSWGNANAANAGSITVRQVLDGASQILTSQEMSSPVAEAATRRVVASTYLGLGAPDQALPHIQRARLLSEEQGDAVGVAIATGMLGSDRMQRGDFKGAEGYLRQALADVQAHGSGDEPYLLQILTSDLAANIAYQRPGDAEAIALMRQAIDAGEGNPALSAVVQHNLAIQLVRLGRLEEAEREVRESLRRMDTLKSAPPERASALRTLAVLLLQLEKNEEAERLAREAVAEAARTRPPDHPMQPNYKAWWGRSLVAVGQHERGGALLRESYDGYRKIRPDGHMELAMPLVGLGSAYRLQGKLADAERTLRSAEAILRRNPAQRDRTADMAGELGLTLRAMGRTAEAQRYLDESHTILQNAYGDAHPLTRQALARKTRPDASSF